MLFHHIHIYSDDSDPSVLIDSVASEIARLFPFCHVDIRRQIFQHFGISSQEFAFIVEKARIWDLRLPFNQQKKVDVDKLLLYDGFVLQRLLASLILDEERDLDHVHIVLTDMLTCTFSDDDWRYHGRAVICGTPAIISKPGIVEAPAKPKEFYYLAGRLAEDKEGLKKKLGERFIDYGDKRLTQAVIGYTLQALFYFVTYGEPFCEDRDCRLLNAHWQEDLIRTQVERPLLCSRHQALLSKFNIGIDN